jgi:phage tail protein X
MSDVTPEPPEGFHTSPSPKTGGLLRYRFHGLPVVPILGVSALAITGYYLYKRVKNGAATAGTTPSTSTALPTTDTTGATADTSLSGGWANIGGGAAYDGVNSSGNANTSSFSSNSAWANNAINGLVGQTTLGNNAYSPIDIQNALMNEINGVPLASNLQQEIVNAAIAAYGEPPQPITGGTTPALQTAKATSGAHPYTTKTGDTLDAILQSAYGQVDPAIVSAFRTQNAGSIPIVNGTEGQTLMSGLHLSATLIPGQILNLPIFTEGTLP